MTREQAIKELTELLPEEFLSEYTDAIKIAIKALEQEPKIGHWEKDEYGNIHCTFCGCNAMYDKIHYPDGYFGKVIRVKTDYCPTCGARMKGVQKNDT